jgi:hypothetical protein
MRSLILRLLDPAPTSPFNPFYGQPDNRSVHQQVVSGLRLAGGLAGGLLILGMASWSIASLLAVASPNTPFERLAFWTMLGFASVTMFVTVHRWVSFVPAFYFLSFLRVLGVLMIGSFSSSWKESAWAARIDFLELVVACIAVIGFTWRFLGARPASTTLLDRFALTLFVLTQIHTMAVTGRAPRWPSVLGYSALAIAWCVYRWNRAGVRWKHDNGDSVTSKTLPEP